MKINSFFQRFALSMRVVIFASLNVFSQSNDTIKPLSYLALGDSYTIGESIKEENQWPRQLKAALATNHVFLEEPRVMAKTGWRTDDMLTAAKNDIGDDTFDIVSLLIGVNNEYQGKSFESFEHEFELCLKYAISKSSYGKKGVFVLSIPDYGYTPFGKKKQQSISKRINAYNKTCKRISEKYDVLYINITDISRKVKEDKSLVADDGLHPSAEQYRLWVERAISQVVELISLL
jgi:lysophospholipase L1-like esterase